MGCSPALMMIGIAVGGVGLAVLAFGGVGGAIRSDRTEAAGDSAAEIFVQPEVEVAGPRVATPEEAIDDYYVLLRQGMYDVAWTRTTPEFQTAYYPGGYTDYLRAWMGMKEIEVLSRDAVWVRGDEANVLAELHDTNTDQVFKNTYVLRYDEATEMWLIQTVTTVW
ncbi:MAG TPA: hypothetical protein VFI11_13655 [Anaerolineales bacterium]|nr:hypothetical protein [Anaerolineales bacterium]